MANTTRIIKAKIQFDTLAAEKSAKALEKDIKKLTKNLAKAEAGTKEFTRAEKELEKALNKVGRSTKNLTQDTKKETQAHENSTAAIQREIAEQRKLQSSLDVTSKEYKQASLQIGALNSKMNQSSGATGLASSSALEFGRIVSDAPYGIRGMANNVSQLASQLSYASIAIDSATGKAIGFSGALKGMWKAMMGPLGILLAFQVVIASIDYFYGSTKKAEEATDDLSDAFSKLYGEITESILKLEVYAEVYEGATVGSNKHTAALKELKDLGFDPAIHAIDEFIEKQKELVVVQATLGEYGDTIKKLADARAMSDDMIAESNENLAKERAALTEAEVYAAKVQERTGEFQFVSQAKYNDALKETQRLTKMRGNIFLNEADAAEKYKKKLEELLDLTIVKPEGGGGRSRRVADFEARNLDMWNEAISFAKKQLQLQDKTDKEKLAATQKYEAIALQVKKDAFIEAEAIRLRKFISKNPAKEKQATANFNKAALVAEEQLQMALSALGVLHSEQRFGQQRDALISFNETQLEERLSSAESQSSALKDYDSQIVGYGSLAYLEENQRKVMALKDAQFEEDQIKLGEKLYAEYGNWEQVSTILAENKNQYEIERMQEEIDLEQQKIDRKKEINAEYISWVAGLSGVLKGIAGENEALATAALVLEKGSAIADIVIKTQAANATVAATTAANASSVALVPGLPAILAAQGKTRILKNNIGAGIAIAKIAATSLTSGGSPSSSGGGDGGGGGTTFNPNFNVVGNSGQNQLAQSISGQVNSPTRAYVVYDDIDEAGNLQNNAISSSGLG